MLPRDHRGKHGIDYTPPALTARLIAQATEAAVDWAWADNERRRPRLSSGRLLAPRGQAPNPKSGGPRTMDQLERRAALVG